MYSSGSSLSVIASTLLLATSFALAATPSPIVVQPDISRLSTHSIPLYHRVLSVSPSAVESPRWIERGTVYVDAIAAEGWFEEGSSRWEELGVGEFYQLAWGDEEETKRNFLSVQSCELLHPPKKSFNETLRLTIVPGSNTIGFNYITNANRIGGGCSAPTSTSSETLARAYERGPSKLEVKVQTAGGPEPLKLKEVPKIVLGEDGKIVAPPKEKTFFEKYWYYILPVVLVAIMGGGDEGAPAAK